jgi:hypothetical protein
MRNWKKVVTLAAAVAVTVGTTSALGAASLNSVGVLDANFPFSDVKALTVGADGTIYVVGGSRSDTWSHFIPPGQTQPTQSPNHPYIWSSTGGIQELPNPSGIASDARGVSIIPQTGEIAVGGQVGNIARSYRAPLGSLNTGAWTGTLSANVSAGTYNINRTRDSDGRTDMAGFRTNAAEGYRHRFYPALGSAAYPGGGGNGQVILTSMSEQGVPVGVDRGGGQPRRAVYGPTPNAALVAIPGGFGVRSEGYGISRNGQWFSGYDHSVGDTTPQAFKWRLGDAGMTLLPMFGTDTNNIAYAINNDGIAVGHTWNSTDSYRATVWDSTGLWDNTGQPQLVQSLLNAAGVDTSTWTRLERVTTISDDGMTLGGYGIWAADGSTRGWVATIPEPATMVLLAIGGLMLRRRRC